MDQCELSVLNTKSIYSCISDTRDTSVYLYTEVEMQTGELYFITVVEFVRWRERLKMNKNEALTHPGGVN